MTEWGTCPCGEGRIIDVREHGQCECGKRFRRTVAARPWPACPECRGSVTARKLSAACVGCRVRRDGRPVPAATADFATTAAFATRNFAAPAGSPMSPNAWKWVAGGLAALVLLVLGVASQDSGTPARVIGNPAPAAVAPVQSGSGWTVLARDMNFVGDALANASDAALRTDYAGLTVGCRELQSAVRTTRTHMPSPDATMDIHLGRALDLFDEAADACIRGASTLDVPELSRASELLPQASDHLRLAIARAQELQR